jgi:AcrR family transcriptional regulator
MTDHGVTPFAGATTRDRIIHATLMLIGERGLGGVTMSAVADGAGVARQTLYNHYADVDSIVAASISQHARESAQQLDAAMRVVEGPGERLAQLIRHIAATTADAPHALDVRHSLSPAAQASLGEFEAVLDALIAEILRDGRRDGVFRTDLNDDVDPVLVRHLLEGLSAAIAHAPDRAAEITASAARTIRAALH